MIVSIDIGSTWTKGAAFQLQEDTLTLIKRFSCPTTVGNLAEGFFTSYNALTQGCDAPQGNRESQEPVKLYYSSSAKGGLSVAALGIVPEITLETAKVVAHSAGAKISRVFSYRLTNDDIRELETNQPDILLFAGGTDGGNSDYVIANAHALRDSKLSSSIIYAGNRALKDEVSTILSQLDFIAVDNLLPSLDSPNPEPARKLIRSIFLTKIVKGKGLDSIIDRTGVQPLPTPYSMYEFSKEIRKHVKGWNEFMLVDMGGATTDIYSAHTPHPAPTTMIRGLPEPPVKRTVEGDLGMRVSASVASGSATELIDLALNHDDEQRKAFNAFIEKVSDQTNHLPNDSNGQQFDAVLAGSCIATACARHAGRMHAVYTADGMVDLQVGRDLSRVKRIIGSGGYPAKNTSLNPSDWFSKVPEDNKGRRILLPLKAAYYRDKDYLLPLLANIAQGFPAQAAHAAISALTPPVSIPQDSDHESCLDSCEQA